MIDSFKNFERLRYRISNDIKNLIADNKNSTNDMKEQVSNTIFATVFSALITEIAFSKDGGNFEWCSVFKMIAIFVVVYIASYFLYNLLYGKIVKYINKRKIHTVKQGMDVMVQIQKDFDNIACDSILLARDYKKEFEALEDNEDNHNLKVFYYYEMMHYLDTACEKTQMLVKNKQRCIRTMNESEGVDIFRVLNIKDMMIELNKFLEDHFELTCRQSEQKEAIKYQREQIDKTISKIIELL